MLDERLMRGVAVDERELDEVDPVGERTVGDPAGFGARGGVGHEGDAEAGGDHRYLGDDGCGMVLRSGDEAGAAASDGELVVVVG